MGSEWIGFVKQWAKKNNTTYSCALSTPECKQEYHKLHDKKGNREFPLGKLIEFKKLMKPMIEQNKKQRKDAKRERALMGMEDTKKRKPKTRKSKMK